MAKSNPYNSPAASVMPAPARPATTRHLWFGYLIAPLVAPVLAALAVFLGGLFFSDPYDTGTPVGIIVVPILMMTVGVAMSYLLGLVIGMPIAFVLHRRNILTGYHIHLAAVIVALLLATGLTMIGLLVDGQVTLAEAALELGMTFLIIAPFTVISATVFWLIACRESTGS